MPPSRAGLDAAVAAGGKPPYLVVNADLPCVTARDLLHARGRRARPRARARGGRRRDDERARPLLTRRSSSRSTAPAALRGSPRSRRRAWWTRRTSSTTSTRVDDLERLARAGRQAHARGDARALARGARREGRGALGRRRRRAVPARRRLASSIRPTLPSIGNVGTTSRCSGCTSRPISTRSSTRWPGVADEERGWGRADETWHALEIGRRARRRGVVPARRPRHRAAPRAHAGCCARARRCPRRRRGSRARSASGARCCPRPTIRCARSSRRRRGRSRSRPGSSSARHRDEVDALHYAGAPEAAAGAGRARRARRGRRDRARAEQPVRLDRRRSSPSTSIRAALEQRRVPCVAVSPLIGGRAVKGPADRMLERLAGGTSPGARRRLLPGPDRRARGRRGRRARRAAGRRPAPS